MVLVLGYKLNEGARITWGNNTLDVVVRDINQKCKPSVVLELIEKSKSKEIELEWYSSYKINDQIVVMIARKQRSSNSIRLGYNLPEGYNLQRMGYKE